METHVLPLEALHTSHQWFAELQPAYNKAQPWIRVFCLKAGAFGDPLCGSLSVEELDTTEPFDALSYCCGPPILSYTITVNDTPGFRVTQNLWNALQRIRKNGSDRRLWVDAVCIDQDDEREKSSQVRHMHAVYSRAEEVCIYFGECVEQIIDESEGEQSQHLVGIPLEVGSKRRQGKDVKVSSKLCTSSEVMVAASELITPYTHPKVLELNRRRSQGYTSDVWGEESPIEFIRALEVSLFGVPASDASSLQFWWRRLWTMQELLLAKHPIVYFGPRGILWEILVRTWAQLAIARKEFPLAVSSSEEVCSKTRIELNYLNVLRNQPIRDLHALLVATVDKGFTEPKDRIFALLGALSQKDISLDYSLTIRITHTSTAMHCITAQCTFDIMYSQWRRCYRLIHRSDGLHSCVPDFDLTHGTIRQDWETPCLTRPEQGRWEGARARTVPHLFSDDDYDRPERSKSSLVLNGQDISVVVIENTASRCRIAFSGARVTTVSKLHRLGQHKLDRILADLSWSPSQYFAKTLCKGNMHWDVSTNSPREQNSYDIYTLLLESCSLQLEGYAGRSVELKFETQRQEIPWGTSMEARKTFHDPKECLDFLAVADECLRRPWDSCLTGTLASRRLDWTNENPSYKSSVHRVLRTLLLAVLKHKTWSGTFFITKDGYLGIGPEATQPGDQIVVLDGARSPFLLRPLVNSLDYALLGDSFVLGLMHGEVKDMYAGGELESRWIVIQ